MRKTVSILLVLIFFFQSVGCLVIFKLQQLQVRNQVRRHLLSNLPESELELIKLPAGKKSSSTFSFRFNDSDEFSYAGKMYDIIKRERHGDMTWYYCFSDKKETNVLAKLNDFVKDQMANNPEKKKQRDTFQRLISSLFPAHRLHFPFVDNTGTLMQSAYRFDLKTWMPPPLTPPPQFS